MTQHHHLTLSPVEEKEDPMAAAATAPQMQQVPPSMLGEEELLDAEKKEMNGGANGAVDDDRRLQSVAETALEDELADDEDDIEEDDENDADHAIVHTVSRAHDFWKFHMRPPDDDEPEDWWFASTAIPLLAATTGPLANVLSIAALVTSWRENYDPSQPGVDDAAIGYEDPHWCIILNAVSLACGFAGNLFLLFNFTRFVRYIIALPATIILWFFASGILVGITTCMHIYVPPEFPQATYSQGFWHAVIAAVLYLSSALLLMINMLGYSLGHYTQHFELTDEQRNLILQTMMFFIWLAGGAGVFARVCGWTYVDALYFCDVTVLTVGFGDFVSPNDAGRGLVFPYSVGGIIMLGLMVSSIARFASELGHNKIVRGHVERQRAHTMERSVASSMEAERRLALENVVADAQKRGERPSISAPFDAQQRTIVFDGDDPLPRTATPKKTEQQQRKKRRRKLVDGSLMPLKLTMTWASDRVVGPSAKGLRRVASKTGRLIVLKEEKDRFMAMRAIQESTRRFKRYFALSMSIIAFALLWCVGAVGFWMCEQRTQGMTYFQALYFCYVSLLTIGYGDLSPKSNSGKPLFVVWSLIAVPTMTILVSDMGDTVVAAYKRGTFTLAAWTILPSKGFFRAFLDRHPKAMERFRELQAWARHREERKRIERGFPVGPEEGILEPTKTSSDATPNEGPTLEQLAEDEPDEHDLARRLAVAIRRTADHLKEAHHRRYTYEEWVEYTRLIRFSDNSGDAHDADDPDDSTDGEHPPTRGIVDWDWIGPDSPMMSDQHEAEWVLDRLCESLDRYMRQQLPAHVRARHRARDTQAINARRVSVQSGGTGAAAGGAMPLASPGRGSFSASSGPPSPSAARRWSVADTSHQVPHFPPPPLLLPPGHSALAPRRPSTLLQSGLDYGRRGDAVSTGRSRLGSRDSNSRVGVDRRASDDPVAWRTTDALFSPGAVRRESDDRVPGSRGRSARSQAADSGRRAAAAEDDVAPDAVPASPPPRPAA